MQGASFNTFQTRETGQAVTAYINQIPLLSLLAEIAAERIQTRQDDAADGFPDDYQDEIPVSPNDIPKQFPV